MESCTVITKKVLYKSKYIFIFEILQCSHPLPWWQLCTLLAFSQPTSWGSHLSHETLEKVQEKPWNVYCRCVQTFDGHCTCYTNMTYSTTRICVTVNTEHFKPFALQIPPFPQMFNTVNCWLPPCIYTSATCLFCSVDLHLQPASQRFIGLGTPCASWIWQSQRFIGLGTACASWIWQTWTWIGTWTWMNVWLVYWCALYLWVWMIRKTGSKRSEKGMRTCQY